MRRFENGGRLPGINRTATITAAIDWIAHNDEPGETELELISEQISVLLVADIWGRHPGYIAQRVLARRSKNAAA